MKICKKSRSPLETEFVAAGLTIPELEIIATALAHYAGVLENENPEGKFAGIVKKCRTLAAQIEEACREE